jgi:8-amino-7-oxononanoate synthase
MDDAWLDVLCREQLRTLEEQSLLRRRQALAVLDPTRVRLDGVELINFASNNYLGLTHHPQVVAAVRAALADGAGVGAGASALVTGHTDIHARAEMALAQWKGTQSAVLLPSGYQAAQAVVHTLSAPGRPNWPGVRYHIDKLSHASLIDAVRNSGQPYRIFPHNGMEKLQRLLAQSPPDQLQVVLTESIFSMDGDAADLRALAELKRAHRFILVLDEAHGSGVYGPGGAGVAAEMALQSIVDVSIVTLSKAIGAGGGAVCASREFCQLLVNTGRAAIYSTALAPVLAAATMAAIEVMRDEPQRQRRVRQLARQVRSRLGDAGLRLPPGDSPIVPVILGTEADACHAAQRLREAGLLVVAIRPPTVPRGSSRLRITLCCEHSDQQIERLISAVREFRRA